MNIFFGLAMIISSLAFAYIYKLRSKKARNVLTMCICIGVVLMFSVQTFGNVLLVLLTLVELSLSALMVMALRRQLRADIAREKVLARKAKRVPQVTVRRRENVTALPYVA